MTNDTDRIIAAQRAESHKTRVLLAWLLGVPLVVGLVWGGIAIGVARSNAAAQSAAADQVVAYDDSVTTDSDPGSLPPPEQPHAAEKFAAALKTAHAKGTLTTTVYAWGVKNPQAMMSIGAGVCSSGQSGDVAVDTANARSEAAMLFKEQAVVASPADAVTVAAISLDTCPP